MRDLIGSLCGSEGIKAVILGVALDSGGVALAAGVPSGSKLDASELIAESTKLIKGGGGKGKNLQWQEEKIVLRWKSYPPSPTKSGVRVRVIGIDLGSKRIGIALSDSDLTVATPLDVVERSGNVEKTILQFLKSLMSGK